MRLTFHTLSRVAAIVGLLLLQTGCQWFDVWGEFL